MEPKIEIHTAPGEGFKEPIIVHLLKGDAPVISYPEKLDIAGDIYAVQAYIEARDQNIDKKQSFVRFDESAKSVTLIQNEQSTTRTKVVGVLTPYPELQDFKINSGENRFTLKELVNLVKRYRIFFADGGTHSTLLASLQKFSASVSAEHVNEADVRGNKNTSLNKKVETGLMETFTLKIPIFKGLGSRTFRVEICYDVTDGGAKFWLESVELYEMEKEVLLEAFTVQKEDFVKKGYTVISA